MSTGRIGYDSLNIYIVDTGYTIQDASSTDDTQRVEIWTLTTVLKIPN